MKSTARNVLNLSLMVCLFALPVFGQASRTTLYGTVSDESGRTISGATVTVVETATGATRTVLTDESGRFRFPLLPVGKFEISVESSGFSKQKGGAVDLRTGEEQRVDVTLSPGNAAETIEVNAPLSETSVSALGTVVPSERVANLPLNGRQVQELALTAPGVSASGGFRSTAFNQFGLATPTDGNAGAFTVNGAGSRSNGFFLDGVDINIPEQGVISFPPLVESIREFQIQTSGYTAEFGRYSGSIVNYVTKSGTNQWHGSVYEFFQNDVLNASNFFNNANRLPKDTLRLNQPGATIGGPILKNRLFIFGNYEANRVRQSTGPFASSLPTQAQRSGSLTYNRYTDVNNNGRFDSGEPLIPTTLDLSSQIAPISRTILYGYIPLPNVQTSGANYIANGIQKLNEDAFSIRTDAQLTQRDLVTTRYSYDDQRQFFPFDIFFVASSLPAFSFPNPERRQSLSVSHIHTFTSSLLNEFRFGLNRQRNPIPNGTVIDPGSIGLPNGAPQNEFGRGLPRIVISGFGGTGGQPFVDNLGASTTSRTLTQFIDNLTLTHGSHTLRFGGEIRRTLINSSAYRALRGSLTFNGTRNGTIDPSVPGNSAVAAFADYLLGRPALATIGSFNPTRGFRVTAFNGFLQDEWRVSSRLTLNFGLRYEFDTPVSEVNGQLANYLPGRGSFVVGSRELPDFYRPDRNNFAPRFGFAYRLTNDGKTVVRGGAGIYYDTGVLQDKFNTARTNAPFALTAIDSNPAPFPSDSAAAVTFTRLLTLGQSTSAGSVDLGFRTPYALQFNLGVQREIGGGWLGEIAYVGRRSVNASRPVNINQVVAANSPAAARLPVGARPFNLPDTPAAARFSNNITQQQSVGQGIYHGLQLRLEKRFSEGLSVLAGYTWSKSIDDVSGIGTGADDTPQDSFNLRAERGVSNFDIPHKLVISSVYELPFGRGKRLLSTPNSWIDAAVGGWQFSGIATFQSGQPFSVTVGAFDSVTQTSNRRPNVGGAGATSGGRFFDPAGFLIPTTGTFGNVGRNTLRGDGYASLDLTVVKNFRLRVLGENGGFQFRTDFFNILNTTNFTLPVSSLSNPAAGRFVSNATAPRAIQFVAKIQF